MSWVRSACIPLFYVLPRIVESKMSPRWLRCTKRTSPSVIISFWRKPICLIFWGMDMPFPLIPCRIDYSLLHIQIFLFAGWKSMDLICDFHSIEQESAYLCLLPTKFSSCFDCIAYIVENQQYQDPVCVCPVQFSDTVEDGRFSLQGQEQIVTTAIWYEQ